ncbi:hypothetical protein [Brevundimonas sp.]|uniref:hypothetical protein n=1 Tax=Brevundimonas sp. TaxID=1871086 RepID=UPI00289DC845|nr:hypothetical protein [Brevundimonas sp.]
MSKREKYLVERIDRSRESAVSRDSRTARSLFLRMHARRTISTALADLNPKEQAVFLRDVLDVAAEHLHPLIGKPSAVSAFGAVAHDLGAGLKLTRSVASAEAERLFARLEPANDGAGDE